MTSKPEAVPPVLNPAPVPARTLRRLFLTLFLRGRSSRRLQLNKAPKSVGEKLTLARRGPSRVVGALLAEGHAQAIKLALGNAFLTESQILKVLAKPDVPARVVAAIAQHAKWSSQYNVRVALLRNPHTPVPCVLAFLPNLTLRDLQDVAKLEGLAPHSRKYIQRELARRLGRKEEQ